MEIINRNDGMSLKIYRADFTHLINYIKYVQNGRYLGQTYTCRFRVMGDFTSATESDNLQVQIYNASYSYDYTKPDNEWHDMKNFTDTRKVLGDTCYTFIKTSLLFDYLEIEFNTDVNHILVYNVTDENSKVFKSLLYGYKHKGIFRDNVDLINPVFEMESNNVLSFNYVYLNMFGRFYFVDSIECVRNGLYRIYCSVDVLMTYREQLKDLQVYVTRQENTYNEYLPDEKLPVEIDNKVEKIYYLTHLFKDFDDIDENMYCFVLTLATSSNFNEYPKKPMTTLLGNITYIMTLAEIRKCINYIISATWKDDVGLLFDDISSSIISLKFYPFDIKGNLGSQWDTLTGGTNSIYIGNTQHAIIKVGETNLSYIKEPIKFELVPSFQFKDKKIRPMTYTPDFVGNNFIIEAKGRPNDVFPYKWKLFQYNLVKSGLDEQYHLFIVHNHKEVNECIKQIKQLTDGK